MTMERKTEQFVFGDGYSTFLRYYPGDRGVVLYLHGIQSNGSWFERSALHLAQCGYSVLLADRRGSGNNSAFRGDVPNYRRWLTDLVELTRLATDRTGRSRVHVVGVSWGGKLAVMFARYYSDLISGMTLVTPGIYPVVDLQPARKMHVALSAVLNPRHQFEIPLNDPRMFTENPHRQDFIVADESRLTTVTARFLCHSMLLDRQVRRYDQHFAFPIRLILAGRERIIDNRRTINLFRSWRSVEKSVTYYPYASHTLEFEPDTHEYFSDLAKSIEQDCG